MSSLFQGGPDTNLSYNADQGAFGGVGSSQASFQDINPNDINQNNTSGQMTPAQVAQQQQQQEAYTNWYNENAQNKQGFQQELAQSQNRNAPTANTALAAQTNIDQSQTGQDRANQLQFINQLNQQANGQGPSLATAQLKQGQEQAVAQQMAMLGSQRGSTNAASAQRQAGMNAASTMAQTNQSAAQARIQEQLNAQGQLGGQLNSLQGQDASMATNQAQLLQQLRMGNSSALNNTNLANMQAYLQNQQMNQQEQGSALASIAGLNQQDLASMQAGEQMQNQDYLARMGANVSGAQIGATEQSAAISAAVNALGSAAAASDERGKMLSLSPGDQKVLTSSPFDLSSAASSVGDNAMQQVGGASGSVGSDAAATAAPITSTPSPGQAFAASLQNASKQMANTNFMQAANIPQGTAPPPAQVSPWLTQGRDQSQANVIQGINNGAISLSPGQQKILNNSIASNNLAPTMQSSPNPGVPNPLAHTPSPYANMGTMNNQLQNNGITIAPSATMQPTLGAPNPTQKGAEASAMGGNAGSQMAFLRALQSGNNNAMMKDAQGSSAYGQLGGSAVAPTTAAPNAAASPAASPTTTPQTMQQAPSASMQAAAPPSIIPTINAPMMQAGPKNIPPNVISVSSDEEKELHTADKATPEEKETNTAVADSKLRDFLGKVDAHQYNYINPEMPGAGKGTYISPMAQELEKSDVGQSMVKDVNGTKMVDYGKGFGTMLASQALHERRLDNVEQGLAKALASRKGR